MDNIEGKKEIKYRHTKAELEAMQALPLEVKILKTQQRIKEWYEYYNGEVYISFSGGKDSTVLLHLARQLYPDIEAVFVDTGLEYPEIRKFVNTFENVRTLRPKMRFDQIIKEYGFNFPSKDVSQYLYYARKGSQWAINKFEGLNTDGTYSEFKQRYKKFKYLLESPFKFSAICCDIMKERPLMQYEKKKKPIIATMASEGQRRKDNWLKVGCNAFDKEYPSSQPMSFWLEQDVLLYLKTYEVPYCCVYGEIIEQDGKLVTTGEQRTGCMFCPVGCHLDSPNKYQRMKITHPKQYDYCIRPVEEKGLGMGEFLDYIGVKYE